MEDYRERAMREEAKRLRKERRIAVMKIVGAACAGALMLVLTVLGFVLRGGEFFLIFLSGILCVGAGFIGLFYPDNMFRLQHMFDIENLHDVQPSEFYYFSNALSSVVAIIGGIVVMAYFAFLM
jgi:hypothetical protein